MSNDLVQDKINQDSSLLSWFTQHLTDNGLTYTDKGYGVMLGWAVEMADEMNKWGKVMPSHIGLLGLGVGSIVNIAVNLGQGSDLTKAVAMAVVEGVIGHFGSAALASIAIGSYPLAIAGGGVAIGYVAAQMATSTWDRYIGPSVDIKSNESTLEYDFRVTDSPGSSLSNFLRPRDGLLAQLGIADNIWTKYNLPNAARWSLVSADNEEPLKIEYKNSSGFFLSGVAGSLRDIYESSDEHKDVVTYICQGHCRDFDVTTSTGNDHVINYYGWSREELESAALAGSKREILAMDYLLPFILENEDDYSDVDPTGYSEQYVKDRAAFLYYMTHEDEASHTGSNIFFNDADLHLTARAGGQTNANLYLWGNGAGPGGGGNDHLYGDARNDTLLGYGGNDYLEGGKGQDVMNGGAGNDIFFIMGEDEAYDEFHGGEDIDTILGGAGDDTIRVHELLASDSIEIIDGGSGSNQIKGTEDGDTIDLSGTQLINIAEIHGEGGVDHITGTTGNDHIYGDGEADELKGGGGEDWLYGGDGMDTLIGGADNDTLIGGEGVDTYSISSGDGHDTIVDEGANILMVNGNVIAGIFKQIDGTNSYVLTTNNQNFTISFGTSTTLTIDGTTSLTLTNQGGSTAFVEGAFGIYLDDAPSTDGFDLSLTGTSSNDLLYYEGSGMYTLGITSNNSEPFYDDDDYLAFIQLTEHFQDDEWDFHNLYANQISSNSRLYIDGGGGDDRLFGFNGSDHLIGGSGNDMLQGALDYTQSADTYSGDLLEGGTGNDFLLGSYADDTLLGGDDQDVLFGVIGRDILSGEDGSDLLIGGAGQDFLTGGDGDDVLYGDGGFSGSFLDIGESYSFSVTFNEDGVPNGLTSTTVSAFNNLDENVSGDDVLDGGAGRDFLSGGHGKDTLLGGSEQDALIGGDGDDILDGGDGNDMLWGDNGNSTGTGNDILFGGSGNDQLQGAGGDDALYGKDGNDILFGQTDNDVLYGGIGEDQLQGGEGNDLLDGGDDADSLFGQAGDDELRGGTGDDWLAGEDELSSTAVSALTGNDTIYGGAGADVLVGGNGTDTLSGDEDNDRLYGGNDNDILYGGDGADSLYGQAGDDEINGGDGDDWLAGEDESSSNAVSSLTGNDTIFGGGGNDILVGGNGNDILSGDDGNDRLYGGIGDDSLYGGTGNDFLYGGTGSDILAGGAGDDTYYISRGSGLKHIVDTTDGHNKIVFQGGINLSSISLSLGSLMISSGEPGDELHIDGVDYDNLTATTPIETIEFSDGQIMSVAEVIAAVGIDLPATEIADSITGTSGRDNINALAGDDTVNSRGGDDHLNLGTGNDMAYAGDGNDIVLAGDDDDTVYGDAGNDTISGGTGIDTLYGGTGDDTIAGDSGDDVLYGGEGADLLNGNVGLDILHGDAGSDTLHGNEDNDQLFGGADNDILHGDTGDDTLDGEDGVDQLFGGDGNDTLYGGAGNDVLTGGVGTDTLVGGLGDDTYMVDSTDDTLTEQVDEGQDTVIASLDYTLGVNIENLQLAEGAAILAGTGNELNNTIEGNTLNNSLYGLAGADTLAGNDGDDLLDGGAGADTLMGGAGDDQYLVDDAADTLIEDASNGSDTVTATVNYTLADNVENLSLQGAEALNGVGNSLANTLTGNEYNNQLDGQAGNDILYGGAGDDSLIGGLGNDQMVGGSGNDTYVVDNANDLIVELANEGIDLVESSVSTTLANNVENLTLTGTSSINATGNTGNNLLQGNSGNNTLNGLAGNDELRGGDGDDRLVGGLGTDLLLGGLGNDTYVVDSLEDTLLENSAEGTDTVESSVTYTLGENLENLILTGTAAVNGTGNELGNHMVGNSASNQLDGGSGADTLEGGSGDDTYLTADEGDTIIEAVNQGMDTEIRNYETSAVLTDNVEYLVLTGSVIQGTGNIQGNTITGNDADNILLGLGGDDTLIGGQGSDHMEGGTGNDIYEVDDIDDVVIEQVGGGYDTIRSNLGITLGAYFENAILTGSANVDAIGNAEDNYLEGNSGDNRLEGGAGIDTMAGGAGNDTYLIDMEGDSITEEAGQGTDTEIRSYDTLYLLSGNVENLTLTGEVYRGNGNELDNIITGNDAANNLWGREGNDTLIGNGGDDALFGAEGQDTLIGGTGDDYYEIDDVGDTIIEGANAGDDFVRSTVSFTLGANVERLAVDGYEDLSVTGNTLANGLWGNDGDNLLTGGQGNDYLEGGLGNDVYVFNRGDGQDSIEDYDLAAGGDVLQFGAGITENDVLAFQYGDNIFFKIKGSDDQIGFIDYYAADSEVGEEIYNHKVNSVVFANDVVWDQAMIQTVVDRANNNSAPTVNSYLPTLQARAGSLFSYVVPVSTITDPDVWDSITYSVKMPDGSALPDWLTFDATTRTLSGTPDTDDVGSLQFILWGTDNYNYSAGEYVTMNIAVPNRAPVLSTALVDKTAALGGVFSYTFTSTTFTDPDSGDTLSYTATLADGSALPTWLSFNAATRTFSGTPSTLGTVSVLVTARDTGNLAATDIFDITVSVQDLTLTGTSSADILNGGAGNDTLSGLAGNDTLNGYAGNDTLNGGTGNDTLLGGLGNDTYVVDATGDVVTENTDEGTDSVQSSVTYTLTANVENLTLTGTSAINGTGNGLDNVLIGNSKANTLTGGAGNDVLNGGSGTDTMLGGTGNDTYVVDVTTDVVTEYASEGTDTIQSGVTFTLGANVENLTLTGSSAINGTGNTLDNILTGNTGANTLSGGTGNDVLIGGLGNDTLTGGAGNDIILFDTALNATSNKDTISDFVAGQDIIKLDKDVFTALTTVGTLAAANFRSSTTGAAGDANDYILYNTTSGALLYDADGNGSGAAVQFATLTTKPAITANDCTIVA